MKHRQTIVSLALTAVVLVTLLANCGAPAEPQVVEVTRVVEKQVVVTQQVEKEVVVTQQVEKQVVVTQQVEKEVVVTATPAPLPEGAKTILRVGTGDSGEGLNPHQEIIARFEAANPDILIQLEAVAGTDYYTRLLTQIASGDAPDIMQIGDDAVPMFVDKGALMPLDSFINGQYPLDPSIYLPGTFAPGQYKDQQWCLPKDFTPLGVYYNKKLFDQYGVAYPTEGWTWDDLLQKAQALTDPAKGIWGIQLPANWTSGFEYWIGAAGGRLISEDGTKYVGYMDSPETIKAVQFYADLYNKYQVAPPVADYNLWGGGNAEFDNGKAAMRLFGRWPQAGYKTNPNIDLGVVPPPAGDQPANVLFWGGFCVFNGTKNAEAAWRFLRFYVGEEGSEVWKDWAIPPVASVAQEAGLTTDPIESAWIKGLDSLVNRAYVYTPYWGETADPALNQALQAVLIDPKADVAKVMQDAAKAAQAALDEKLSQ
jgi:multiple sugar transport system substrate-binding protein